MVAVLAQVSGSVVDYWPRGASRDVFERRDRELLIAGPAGTGKTFGCLWKLHAAALKYPGMRGLMVRKTLTALTASALVTFARITESGPFGVTPFGGSKLRPTAFRYANGSEIVVGGMDKAAKVMSAEYDVIYVNEAIELAESDWEALTTRLRHGAMPYQQLLADCNPDAPGHWLNQRVIGAKTARLESRHEDNPVLFDVRTGAWTTKGAEYISTLDALTGVRYARLRKGLWAAAEGQVYEGFNRALHVIDRFEIPASWPRSWVIDFGYTNPFVCQWWAQDPDGRLYLYREIYHTQRLVTDHAGEIQHLSIGEPAPRAVITDHDAEDRATFTNATGIKTTGAIKTVSRGLQAVANRLLPAGDGKPRLFLLRDSLVELDQDRFDKRLPVKTEDEFDSYVWDTRSNRKRGEEPMKEHDHGMDAMRYLVMHFDGGKKPIGAFDLSGMEQENQWAAVG